MNAKERGLVRRAAKLLHETAQIIFDSESVSATWHPKFGTFDESDPFGRAAKRDYDRHIRAANYLTTIADKYSP